METSKLRDHAGSACWEAFGKAAAALCATAGADGFLSRLFRRYFVADELGSPSAFRRKRACHPPAPGPANDLIKPRD
jgi:hypothetical protein